jgi:hypothetical protein
MDHLKNPFKDIETDSSSNIFYKIHKNYPLFRAISYSDGIPYMKDNHYYFFGLKDETPEYIESYENNYGIIHLYETIKPIRLLAIDKLDKNSNFYKEAPNPIKKILEKNYGFNNKIRYSEKDADVALSDYICNVMGFDGYASNTMNTHDDGKFHPELMICNSNTKTKYIERITKGETKIHRIIDNYRLKNAEKERKLAKANKRARNNTPPPSPPNNFNFSMNELSSITPPTTPPRLPPRPPPITLPRSPPRTPTKTPPRRSPPRTPRGGMKNKRTTSKKLYKNTFKNSKSRTYKNNRKTSKMQ